MSDSGPRRRHQAAATKLSYLLMVLDFEDQTAALHKVDVEIDLSASTIKIVDHGLRSTPVGVDPECFVRTEAAYVELEAHLMSLGVKLS